MPGIIGFTVESGQGQSATPEAMAMIRRLCHRPGEDSRLTCLGRAYFGRAGGSDDIANGWPGETESPTSSFGALDGSIYSYGRYENSDILENAKSDIDKILALYDAGEDDFYAELEGAFTFALWDGASETLILATDRYGRRNLYFMEDETTGCVWFASELKSLLAHGGIIRELDPEALVERLIFGHLLGQRTWIKRVSLLPPATVLTFGREDKGSRRYYQLDFTDRTMDGTPDEVADDLAERFARALRDETRGAERLIMMTGGGMNCRAALAFASAAEGIQTQTHTFGIEGSEDVMAAEICSMLANTPFTLHPIEARSLWDAMEETIYQSDGELGLEHAGFHLTASKLDGSGAVALFGGGGSMVLGGMDQQMPSARMVGPEYFREFWSRVSQPLQTISLPQLFRPEVAQELPLQNLLEYVESIHSQCPSREAWQAESFFRVYHQRRRRENAIELLVGQRLRTGNPYFHPAVAELGFHLPWELRQGRPLLLAAIRQSSPQLNLLREIDYPWRLEAEAPSFSGARGAGLYDVWFRSVLRDQIEGLLTRSEDALSAYFDPQYYLNVIVDHAEGRSNQARLLMTMLHTAIVLQRFVLD